MKNLNSWQTSLVIGILLSLILFASGCNAGMSKEDRLNILIGDIEAGRSVKEHFQGHANAPAMSGNEFLSTMMNPSNGVDVIGKLVAGDTFSLDFNVTAPAGTQTLTGSFYNAGSGGLSGDDWYIFQVSVPDPPDPNISIP